MFQTIGIPPDNRHKAGALVIHRDQATLFGPVGAPVPSVARAESGAGSSAAALDRDARADAPAFSHQAAPFDHQPSAFDPHATGLDRQPTVIDHPKTQVKAPETSARPDFRWAASGGR